MSIYNVTTLYIHGFHSAFSFIESQRAVVLLVSEEISISVNFSDLIRRHDQQVKEPALLCRTFHSDLSQAYTSHPYSDMDSPALPFVSLDAAEIRELHGILPVEYDVVYPSLEARGGLFCNLCLCLELTGVWTRRELHR